MILKKGEENGYWGIIVICYVCYNILKVLRNFVVRRFGFFFVGKIINNL